MSKSKLLKFVNLINKCHNFVERPNTSAVCVAMSLNRQNLLDLTQVRNVCRFLPFLYLTTEAISSEIVYEIQYFYTKEML